MDSSHSLMALNCLLQQCNPLVLNFVPNIPPFKPRGIEVLLWCVCSFITGDTLVVDGANWMWRPEVVPRELVSKVSRARHSRSVEVLWPCLRLTSCCAVDAYMHGAGMTEVGQPCRTGVPWRRGQEPGNGRGACAPQEQVVSSAGAWTPQQAAACWSFAPESCYAVVNV